METASPGKWCENWAFAVLGVAPNVHSATRVRVPFPWRPLPTGGGVSSSVNLGMELEREVSPATYLWQHRREFPDFSNPDALPAAIEAGIALENWQSDRARRCWRVVVSAAREAGRSAALNGVTLRGIVGDIDRVRDAIEVVLFDGRLPPDVAVRAARLTAKMCNRAVEHAIATYWEALRAGEYVRRVPTW